MNFLCVVYQRKTSKQVGPAAILRYIRSVQCGLEELIIGVNLFQGPIFNEPNLALVATIENLFAKQQAEGTVTKPHNVLAISDIQMIFNSEFCNLRNVEVCRNRLVFAVGFWLGIRTLELHGLNVTELKQQHVDGSRAYVYCLPVGAVDGELKNRPGFIKAIKQRARCIPIHDTNFLYGNLNVYRIIDDHFSFRSEYYIHHDRFFLGIQSGTKNDPSTFFKNQPAGKKIYVVHREKGL